MATKEFQESGQTRNQELYRMNSSSPASPNRPMPPSAGGAAGGGSSEIPGTRAAPNGKVMRSANSFAAGFLQSAPGAARLAQQIRNPESAPAPDYSDLSAAEGLELYETLRSNLPEEQRRRLDVMAAQLRG